MSGILTGAALQRGPRTMRARLVLVAITDNADDYGFACVSLETIAEKALCVPKTVTRVLAALEHEGWMQIRRKAIGGRNNLYFVNLARLGITPSERSRMSEWHRQVLGAEVAGQKTAAARAVKAAGASTEPADTMSPGTAQAALLSGSSVAPRDIVSHGNELPETVRKSDLCGLCGHSEDDHSQPADEGDSWGPFYCGKCDCVMDDDDERRDRILRARAEENTWAVESAKGHFDLSQGTSEDAPRDISAVPILKNVERRTLKTTPLPPDKRGDGGSRSSVLFGSVEWASAGSVMQECNLADTRIRIAITRAIVNFCKRTDATAAHTAELMIESYRTWIGVGALLRYRWSPRKFFADGHWAEDWHAWPLVPEAAARLNRRRDPNPSRGTELDQLSLEEVNALRARMTPPQPPLAHL